MCSQSQWFDYGFSVVGNRKREYNYLGSEMQITRAMDAFVGNRGCGWMAIVTKGRLLNASANSCAKWKLERVHYCCWQYAMLECKGGSNNYHFTTVHKSAKIKKMVPYYSVSIRLPYFRSVIKKLVSNKIDR